jgi:branched-subunit amino acid aminotransferase/4-amino-4-deoxychorismate lyase
MAPLPEGELGELLLDLGRRAFGTGAGVVRLALRPGCPVEAVGATRPLGCEASQWRTTLHRERHPGPRPPLGVKRDGEKCYDTARRAARELGSDEALLLDAAGFLVEGARSNVFLVRPDGALVTPPLSRGAVAGVAREIVLERIPEAVEDDVPRALLTQALEIILVNAVRGAVRAAAIDGGPLAGGAPHWTERLRELLLEDPPPP